MDNNDRKKNPRQSSRRPRGRHQNSGNNNNNNNNNRSRSVSSLRHQSFDSTGPGVRVRGNARQVFEKYQALARDAASAGDTMMAESYLQHAEHYYRITQAIEEATAAEQRKRVEKAAPAKQPDMPANYFTPEGKGAPTVDKPEASKEEAKKPLTKPTTKPAPRARSAAKPTTPKEETKTADPEPASSSPFFSLDESDNEGSQPQKLVAGQ